VSYRETGYLNVLVIDDDPDMRELMSRVILAEGHQVIAVDSAEHGLEQLPYYTFEVAFLDHHLPGMEGLVLGEYLRHNNPHMQVALVTGGADDRIRRMVAELGIHLIEKPFDIEQIVDVVALYLRLEAARVGAARASTAAGWAVDVAGHLDVLSEYFGAPNVPRRLEDLIARKVRFALDRLRYGPDGSELDRAAAYAGILAARVLGVDIGRHKDGRHLHEVYDALMRERDREPAFSPRGEADEPRGP